MNGSNFECFPPQPPLAVLISCENSESFLLMKIFFRACPHQQRALGSGCCFIGTPFESNAVGDSDDVGETETPQPLLNDFVPSLFPHSLVVTSPHGETRILAALRESPTDLNLRVHLDGHVCRKSIDTG